MKKKLLKKGLTFLAAITIMLTFAESAAILIAKADVMNAEANGTNVIDTESADPDTPDVSQPESSYESTDSFLDDTSVSGNPDGDYICTLKAEEVNSNIRIIDNSSSLPISGSSYEVFWPGHSIMYVNNDNTYADSMGKWRLVYCYDQGKAAPSGTLTFSGWSNKKVAYAMYYGTMYWGETCRYAPYSTGNWKLDAMATQSAIWVLSGQYTLDHVVDVIIDCCNGTATREQRQAVEAATQKIVNDANKESNYTGWNSDGWFDLSLSGKSIFNITGYKDTWNDNGKGYYVSGGAFQTTFKSYYGYDMRSQITSFKVSVPDEVEVVKADSKTFSDFSLYISEAQYNEWKKTGKEITVTVTMKIPRLWSAGLYKSSDDNYQRTTLLTYKTKSDTATFTKTITLTIPKETNPYAKLQIKKSSFCPDTTDNNNCYSLANAEYTVYSDENCTTKVGTLVTDEKGNTEALTLETGTYYIRETVSPSGFYLDSGKYTVVLTEAHSTTPYVLEVQDTPVMDPIGILLKKIDADTNQGIAQNTASLENAEFIVKYYDVIASDTDPASKGFTPVRTWVFKTDKDGFASLNSSYLVSGDDFYLNPNGTPSLPIGTITIQESKAPEGYLLNDKIFVVPLSPDVTTEGVTTYAAPVIPENILKLLLTKTETGTDEKIPGAVFEHTRPNGEKEILTTDENGTLSFVGLEWGNHMIKEISVQDGYLINSNEIRFTVAEDNNVVIDAPSSGMDLGITAIVAVDGNIHVNVEDETAPYSLKLLKKNDKGEYLAGAEFTLYTDKNCENVIAVKETDADGVLIFDGLEVGKTFYVLETRAPKGYALSEDAVIYKIYAESSPVDGIFDYYVNDEKYTISDTDENGSIYLSGSWADRMINLEVINNEGMLLPETGSGMTLVLYLLGAAIMISVLIKNKKLQVEV